MFFYGNDGMLSLDVDIKKKKKTTDRIIVSEAAFSMAPQKRAFM